MKQTLIRQIAESGIMTASANTLDAAQAYKVLRWKSAIKKAYEDQEEARKSILKEVFTEDELTRLNSGSADEELQPKLQRFSDLYGSLMGEEVNLDLKKVPYEAWHALSKENSFKLGVLETELEGVLFDAPKEEEE